MVLKLPEIPLLMKSIECSDTYGISVSSRHLDLIADMMTREGTYLAFNRQGIDSSTSAFMKMSYETTCQF